MLSLKVNAEPKKDQLGPSLIVEVTKADILGYLENCDYWLNIVTAEGNWQHDFNH